MPFNVYVTRQIPEAGLAILREHCDRVDVSPQDCPLDRRVFLAQVKGRDGVVCQLTDLVDEEVLQAAGPQCRVFANFGVGFNNIDLEAATRHGALITNTPGILSDTTADLAWSLMLSVARRIVESDRYCRSGKWTGFSPMLFLGHDIHGATLGIVGAGRIGTAAGLRSTGFNMKLLYFDDRENDVLNKVGGKRVGLGTLLQESDFVSLHVPLLDSTYHMIGRDALAMMKPTAYLINTARGPVVDEQALVEALREKRIAGAGLDVYENEPELAPGLAELENVVCIPHLGSATHATRSRMSVMVAQNVVAALKGETPPNLVNTDVAKDT